MRAQKNITSPSLPIWVASLPDKVAVILSAVGGPGLSVRNSANIMEYGRLWKETGLQVLMVFDCGVKQSALNEIKST